MKTEVNPSQPKVQAEQKKSIMGSPSYRLLGVMEQVMKDLSNRKSQKSYDRENCFVFNFHAVKTTLILLARSSRKLPCQLPYSWTIVVVPVSIL